MSRAVRRASAALLVLTLLAAACGGDDDDTGAATTTVASEPRDDPYAGPPTEPAGSTAEVATAESDLGTILVDGEGMTLYLFANDTGGESTCYGECRDAWPPLTVDGGGAAAGGGVDASLLGTTERTDGLVQVTYAGHPLYRFASDAAPGDTNGQGIGDVWFVVGPDGEPVAA